VVLLAALGGAAWWVSSNKRQPVAQPTVTTSTPTGPSGATRATCKAAWKLAKVKVPDLGAFPPLITLARASGEPALEAIATKYPDLTDYVEAREALIAIAGWCDDHDVEWPNGE
jgi:hypothetical protein